MTVYSSNTSLILTDLLMITSGQNYSFAVAVTDSTGQHGPWSDQLMVTDWNIGISTALTVLVVFRLVMDLYYKTVIGLWTSSSLYHLQISKLILF